jgi:hypothetical protein
MLLGLVRRALLGSNVLCGGCGRPLLDIERCSFGTREGQLGWRQIQEGWLPGGSGLVHNGMVAAFGEFSILVASWILYVSSHYHFIGLEHFPSHAVKKTLKKAHTLAWSLWDHCNDILHRVDRPRIHSANDALDAAIIQEHTSGNQDLPPTDHHYQVTSARLRQIRRL